MARKKKGKNNNKADPTKSRKATGFREVRAPPHSNTIEDGSAPDAPQHIDPTSVVTTPAVNASTMKTDTTSHDTSKGEELVKSDLIKIRYSIETNTTSTDRHEGSYFAFASGVKISSIIVAGYEMYNLFLSRCLMEMSSSLHFLDPINSNLLPHAYLGCCYIYLAIFYLAKIVHGITKFTQIFSGRHVYWVLKGLTIIEKMFEVTRSSYPSIFSIFPTLEWIFSGFGSFSTGGPKSQKHFNFVTTTLDYDSYYSGFNISVIASVYSMSSDLGNYGVPSPTYYTMGPGNMRNHPPRAARADKLVTHHSNALGLGPALSTNGSFRGVWNAYSETGKMNSIDFQPRDIIIAYFVSPIPNTHPIAAAGQLNDAANVHSNYLVNADQPFGGYRPTFSLAHGIESLKDVLRGFIARELFILSGGASMILDGKHYAPGAKGVLGMGHGNQCPLILDINKYRSSDFEISAPNFLYEQHVKVFQNYSDSSVPGGIINPAFATVPLVDPVTGVPYTVADLTDVNTHAMMPGPAPALSQPTVAHLLKLLHHVNSGHVTAYATQFLPCNEPADREEFYTCNQARPGYGLLPANVANLNSITQLTFALRTIIYRNGYCSYPTRYIRHLENFKCMDWANRYNAGFQPDFYICDKFGFFQQRTVEPLANRTIGAASVWTCTNMTQADLERISMIRTFIFKGTFRIWRNFWVALLEKPLKTIKLKLNSYATSLSGPAMGWSTIPQSTDEFMPIEEVKPYSKDLRMRWNLGFRGEARSIWTYIAPAISYHRIAVTAIHIKEDLQSLLQRLCVSPLQTST